MDVGDREKILLDKNIKQVRIEVLSDENLLVDKNESILEIMNCSIYYPPL